MAGETTSDRMRAIREERGEKQPAFAVQLTKAAGKLKLPVSYEGTKVSRLETGRQEFSLEDILVIASLDKQKRGRDWLAWGNSTVSVAELPPHPETIVESEAPIPVEQPAHLHHAADPRRRARGK